MLDSLALLVIVFAAMSVVSLIGVALLYLVKNETVKKGMFYFLSVWGMIVAWCNVQMIPMYMMGELVLAFGLGALSVIGLLVQLCMKTENKFKIARALVTISVAAGMIDAFMF